MIPELQSFDLVGEEAKAKCLRGYRNGDGHRVWKGLALKSVTDVAGMQVIAQVVDFTEDAYILPATFEVPTF